MRFASSMLVLLIPTAAWAGEYDREPIAYSRTKESNAITRLQQRMTKGEVSLDYDDDFGYLPAILKALDVPRSSQTLVFSKTSFQRQRISPRTPRAIYFNDDLYVAYCHGGDMVELSTCDTKLGTVFYTFNQTKREGPRFVRQDDNCLLCHASSAQQSVPGHLVRSVYTDAEGNPNLMLGSFRVDHATPMRKRWGGWYVSGSTGKHFHLGNLTVRGNLRNPDDLETGKTATRLSLDDAYDADNYVAPHSDVVALMVMEHQTEMHNRLARASFQVRQALYEQADLDKAFGRPKSGLTEASYRRIKSACEPVVKFLLFADEAPLFDRVEGKSTFAQDFAARGPRDAKGRSLRDFDLRKRMFQVPCSYLIYHEMFDGLPAEAKEYIWSRLLEILENQPGSGDFPHLSESDRRAIYEVLVGTKPNLPAAWKESTLK